MTRSGWAVQTKGLGSALVSARKRLMAAWSSTIDRNTPRLSRRRVSLENNVSTALSQERVIAALLQDAVAAQAEIAQLRFQLAPYRRAEFGRSWEKLAHE